MHLRRRDLLALLTLLPLAAGSQEKARGERRRIVVMVSSAEDDPETQPRMAAFNARLRDLGWVEGRNIEIVVRYAAANPELMRRHASELADLRPDLLVVQSNITLDVVRREGVSLPTIFLAVSDPVGGGYVKSLARPGGQMTGFTNFEPATGAKWLQLLKELSPATTRVTILMNPNIAANRELARSAESAALAMGVTISLEGAADAGGKEQAIAAAGKERNGGVIVMPNPANQEQRKAILAACARHRVPAIYPFAYFARDGGLASYGLDVVDMFKSVAGYVDRVLKGAQPGDLAVQQPTRYELLINRKTAQALGLRLPAALLAGASEVVE